MENEEILKEKEVLASTEDRTALDQTMLSRMETFEVNGKVLLPNNDIACDVFLFATPWSVAYQAPPSLGIFQARILQWVAISFSRVSSWPRDQTRVSCITGRFFTTEPLRKPTSRERIPWATHEYSQKLSKNFNWIALNKHETWPQFSWTFSSFLFCIFLLLQTSQTYLCVNETLVKRRDI